MKQLSNRKMSAIWRKYAVQLDAPLAKRLNLPEEVQRAHTRRCAEARIHLQPWLGIYDGAVVWLNAVYCWSWEKQIRDQDKARAGSVLLIGHANNLLIAIRLLVVAGFEEQARPLVRTFCESIELLLAVLADDSFNVDYTNGNYDPNEFWKKHVRYGRLTPRIEAACKRAGLSDQQLKAWTTERAKLKKFLSGATHVSHDSVLRSSFVPSLVKRSTFFLSAFGHHSIHSPGLLLHISNYTWKFGSIVMRLIKCNNAPSGFLVDHADVKSAQFQRLVVAYHTLQHLLNYEQLPPLPEFSEVE